MHNINILKDDKFMYQIIFIINYFVNPHDFNLLFISDIH